MLQHAAAPASTIAQEWLGKLSVWWLGSGELRSKAIKKSNAVAGNVVCKVGLV